MTENEAIRDLEYLIEECSAYPPETGVNETIGSLQYCITALREIQQYREIGTVEECREARERQKPMKVKEVHVDEYYCPACGSENCCDQGIVGDRYCPYCGHAIDENLEGMEDE